jgi:lipid-A-disaccharide synthase-like uncharacterized protein
MPVSGPVLVALAAVSWLLQRRRIRRHQPPREAWWMNLFVEVGFVWYALTKQDMVLLTLAGLYAMSYLDYLRLWRRQRHGVEQ